MICYEPRWWEVLTRSHSRYASVCTVPFHCFNLQQLQLVWFNNSKKVSFSVSGSVTKSGCSSVFFKVFFIDTPVETYSYSFGRENNCPFSVSIQQDFISFLNVQIDRQKKYKLFLFWMLVNIPCEEFYTSTLTWNKMLKLRKCKISTWPKDFS